MTFEGTNELLRLRQHQIGVLGLFGEVKISHSPIIAMNSGSSMKKIYIGYVICCRKKH